jgi:D-alanyl-D-alanine carboxypeptidase/D-alanyl-D-alanine-endopeptidase (penicillin-binding protein 4)
MKKMKIKLLSILLFTQFCFANLEREIDKIKKELNLTKKDLIGFSIHDKEKTLSSFNENEHFIPASTFKIVSAFYILENLSPNFKFETKFGYRGKINKGILEGDLVLNLSGDPYLLTSDLYNMALTLRQRGIKEVKGSLIISSNFPSLQRIGNVGLDDQPYNQGLSALNVNFNRFKAIRYKDKALAFPMLDYLQMEAVKDLSPGEIFRRKNIENKEAWQSSKLEKYFYEVPIRDTLKFNAHYLLKLINDLGIKTSPNVTIGKEIMTKELYSKKSLSTLKLVELALEYSNNLFIEVLTLKAAKAKNLKEASDKLKLFYKEKFPSLGIHNLNFENNSGLTLNLKIRTKTIAQLLQKIAYKKYEDRYFITLLSLAGNGGFLAKRFLNERTHLKFFAKTGSLDYVNGICGYSMSSQRSFCLFINNKELRSQLQGRNTKQKDQLRRNAKKWKRNTDAMLERVINNLFFHKLRLL